MRLAYWPSRFPLGQKGGNCFRGHMLKLFLALCVEQISMGVQECERGNSFGNWNVILAGDVDVMIHVANVDADDNIISGQEFGIGRLLVIVVKYLAVPTPVASEFEQDALMAATSHKLGRGYVRRRVGRL